MVDGFSHNVIKMKPRRAWRASYSINMKLFVFPLLALSLQAQDSVIKVDVDLVNVLCTVRNKGGGLVGNLEKGASTIFQSANHHTTKSFTRNPTLPPTTPLLV